MVSVLRYFDETRGWSVVAAVGNARNAQTGTYTVLNSDKSSVIALGGNAFYTLTFSAASNYDSDFIVTVLNEDAGRGKTIALDSLPSFILWPGQSIIVYSQNNVWRVLGKARWKLTASVTLYVDPALGNDSNDGLAPGAGATKTMFQAAVVIAMDQWDVDASIPDQVVLQLEDGTHTSGLHLPGPLVGGAGNATLVIQGNSSTPANVIVTDTDNVNGGVAIAMFDGAIAELKNFQIQGGGVGNDTALFVQTNAVCRLEGGIIFGACAGGPHMQIDGARIICDGNYSIAGSALYHVLSSGGIFSAQGKTIDITANLAFTIFANAQTLASQVWGGATINLNTHTVTGQRYNSYGLSLIDTFGGGAAFLPGDAGGATSVGGLYN